MTISPSLLLTLACIALLPLTAMLIVVALIEKRQQKRLRKQIESGREMLLLAEALRIEKQKRIAPPARETRMIAAPESEPK